MTLLRNGWLYTFVLTSIVGCASTGGLTPKDVRHQYPEIQALTDGVAAAKATDGELLAPDGVASADKRLSRAVDLARDAKKDKAIETAKQGLSDLEHAETHMRAAREVLAEVLMTRERAKQEGAPALFADAFAKADKALAAAARKIEKGDRQDAEEKRPALLERYAQLELDALKKGTAEGAAQAVKHAHDMGADDYAPRTLKQAEEELRLVSSVLSADRTQTAKATAHAKKAIWLARRAEAITQLARNFEERDYSLEDIVLWHQRQLEIINQPLQAKLPFDEADEAVVDSLRRSIHDLTVALDDMRELHQKERAQYQETIEARQREQEEERRALEESLTTLMQQQKKASAAKVADLQARYSEEALRRQEAERKQQEIAARFAFAESAFKPEEATVVRTGNDVQLQVHGFAFAPGQAEIAASNFGLLHKIASVIGRFPDSEVLISGHTDSRGSASRNLALSAERAKNVENFLVEVAKVPAARIQSAGRGETRPVASNDTAAGRAQNRRIEVLIHNAN